MPMLRFQPGWRYLRLFWPVHRLSPVFLSPQRLAKLSKGGGIGVRVAPGRDGVTIVDLPSAVLVLEDSLRGGKRLSDSAAAARA